MFLKFCFLFGCYQVLSQWFLWNFHIFASKTLLLSSNIHLGAHSTPAVRTGFFLIHITSYLPVVSLIWYFIAQFFSLVRFCIYSEFKFVPSISIPSADFFTWLFTHFSGRLSVYWEAQCLAEITVKLCLWSPFVFIRSPFHWPFIATVSSLLLNYLSIQRPSSLSHGHLDSFSFWHWVLSKAFCDLFGKLQYCGFSKAVEALPLKNGTFSGIASFCYSFYQFSWYKHQVERSPRTFL